MPDELPHLTQSLKALSMALTRTEQAMSFAEAAAGELAGIGEERYDLNQYAATQCAEILRSALVKMRTLFMEIENDERRVRREPMQLAIQQRIARHTLIEGLLVHCECDQCKPHWPLREKILKEAADKIHDGIMPRRAFTLIELLVCVLTIGALMGLVAPELARSRAAARGVVCRSNLRSLATCLHLYTDEQRDFPPADLAALNVPYELFRCPADKKTPRGPGSWSYNYDAPNHFADVHAPGPPYPHMPSCVALRVNFANEDLPVFIERWWTNHGGWLRFMVTFGGRVEELRP